MLVEPLRLRLSFFFSSRRRHTRWNCDWSSDVCSSDLACSPRSEPRFINVTPAPDATSAAAIARPAPPQPITAARSEEHTSELQSQFHLVCRLLLEKKKKQKKNTPNTQQKKNNTNTHTT